MTHAVVLNTRPREQAAELSAALAQVGLESLEAPAIEIEPAWDAADLTQVCDALQAHAFDWVVLPSQNAGRALVSDLHTARIVCGVATARALGLSAEVVIQKFSASAALEAMRPLIRPGQRVLMPRAAEGREELLDGLRALGAVVSTPVAYRTVAIDTAAACLRTRQVDVLTLCSPSAVASLMGALPPAELEGLAIVCLGETTAAAARAAGLRVEAVAARTSMRALVDAVSAVVRTRVAAV